MNRSK